MLIYGVCISEIKETNNEKVENFLEELAEKGYDSYWRDFVGNRKSYKDGDYVYTANDFLYDYESDNSYCGLSAFLRDVIAEVEGINIACDDPNGVHYLGISADVPWFFNEKTRNLTQEKFVEIMSMYINKITDEVLDIRWWNVCDDCDY